MTGQALPVLVTGASGFIGRALCRHLKERGHRVRAVLRRPVAGPWDDQRSWDFRSPELPLDLVTGVEAVFHLAGWAHSEVRGNLDQRDIMDINVRGTERLARACASAGVERMVYFSSVKAVGDPRERCVDEEWTDSPTDPYGRSKRAAEEQVLAIGQAAGMHVCCLRPALVYGAGVKANLRRLVAEIDRRGVPPIPNNGNRRSLVYLEDLADAAMLAAWTPAANGKRYFVTDGQAYSTRDICQTIGRAFGKPIRRFAIPEGIWRAAALLGDAGQRLLGRNLGFNSDAYRKLFGSACYDSARIRRELSFQPSKSLTEAAPEMISAYRDGLPT